MTKKKSSDIETTEFDNTGFNYSGDDNEDESDDSILNTALEESRDELINEDEATESWKNPVLMANRKANP